MELTDDSALFFPTPKSFPGPPPLISDVRGSYFLSHGVDRGAAMSKEGIPIDVWSGAYATKELHESMKQFVESSNRSSRRMLQLTWAIVCLTVAMFFAVIVQILVPLY